MSSIYPLQEILFHQLENVLDFEFIRNYLKDQSYLFNNKVQEQQLEIYSKNIKNFKRERELIVTQSRGSISYLYLQELKNNFNELFRKKSSMKKHLQNIIHDTNSKLLQSSSLSEIAKSALNVESGYSRIHPDVFKCAEIRADKGYRNEKVWIDKRSKKVYLIGLPEFIVDDGVDDYWKLVDKLFSEFEREVTPIIDAFDKGNLGITPIKKKAARKIVDTEQPLRLRCKKGEFISLFRHLMSKEMSDGKIFLQVAEGSEDDFFRSCFKFKDSEPATPPQLIKFKVNGQLNILIDIFYQLKYREEILNSTRTEIVRFIIKYFFDPELKQLSVNSIKTYLSKSKVKKRPKKEDAIDIRKYIKNN